MRINARIIRDIYRPEFIVLNVAIAVMYYFIITALLSIQQRGIPISTVPLYLIYLLAVTSSICLTIALYSIRNTRRNQAKLSAGTSGSVTAVVGGVIAGCGCQAAILANVLVLFTSAGEAGLISNIAAENSPTLFILLIIINIFVAAYYVNKLSKPECRIRK